MCTLYPLASPLCLAPVFVVAPTHYTLGLYTHRLSLSRSSGATLLLELGLLWILVHIGYFICGLIRRDHALSLWSSCHSHIPCFCFSGKKREKRNVEKKRERKKEKLWIKCLAWGYDNEIAKFPLKVVVGFVFLNMVWSRWFYYELQKCFFRSLVPWLLASLFPNVLHFSPITISLITTLLQAIMIGILHFASSGGELRTLPSLW